MLIVWMALLNARRNLVRSSLTALTVALGTAILCVSLSWIDGVFGDLMQTSSDAAGHARVVHEEFIQKEALNPLYAHIRDVQAHSDTIRAVPGVVDAMPRIITGATMTTSDEIGDVFGAVFGAPLRYYRDRLHLPRFVVSGELPTKEGGDGIVLGGFLAARLDARIGDTVVLLGMTQDGSLSPLAGPVVAIVNAGNALIDQAAFLPLERVQYLVDIEDGATELLVFGADRDGAPALAERLPSLDPTYQIQAWSHREPWAGILAVTGVIQGLISAAIVFVTALGVWNTMMMSVLERTREIGVLRALGLGRLGTVSLFALEAIGIATIGGVLGVIVGGSIALYLEQHGITFGGTISQNMSAALPVSSVMYADMSVALGVKAMLLAWTMAVVGTTLPALRAASIPPIAALRHH